MAEKKIGDKIYQVGELSARDALKLWADIMRIAGPAAPRLPSIIIALSRELPEQQAMADVAAIGAISDMLRSSETDEIISVIERIVSLARIMQPSKTYRDVDLDADFSGPNLKYLIPVASFVLKENFSDFFIGSEANGILSLLKGHLVKSN